MAEGTERMTMHMQTPAPPTGGHAQAITHAGYRQRRDAALASLAHRAGAEAPAIQEGGRPKPAPPYMLGESQVEALLAELILALAGEVDELRTEIDGLKAALAGARNGANPR